MNPSATPKPSLILASSIAGRWLRGWRRPALAALAGPLAILGALAFPAEVQADFTWLGSNDSNWDNTTVNWGPLNVIVGLGNFPVKFGQTGYSGATPGRGATFDGTAIGTITLTDSIGLTGMSFQANGYTISDPSGTNQLSFSNFFTGGALNPGQVDVGSGFTATVNVKLTDISNVGMTKTGAGTLILTASSLVAGPTNVNAGTLQMSGAGSLYNGGTSAGNLNVNSGATLRLSRTDTFGASDSFSPMVLTVDGGTVRNVSGNFNAFNNPIFKNGANLICNGGFSSDFQAYGLKGTVTISGGGGVATTFSLGTGSNRSINLGNPLTPSSTTFDVGVTGAVGADLSLSVNLRDSFNFNTSAPSPSGLIKTGAGTMTQAQPGSTFSGDLTINGGTFEGAAVANGTGGSPLGAVGAGSGPETSTLTTAARSALRAMTCWGERV